MKDKKHIVEDKEARQKQASDIFHKHFDPWFDDLELPIETSFEYSEQELKFRRDIDLIQQIMPLAWSGCFVPDGAEIDSYREAYQGSGIMDQVHSNIHYYPWLKAYEAFFKNNSFDDKNIQIVSDGPITRMLLNGDIIITKEVVGDFDSVLEVITLSDNGHKNLETMLYLNRIIAAYGHNTIVDDARINPRYGRIDIDKEIHYAEQDIPWRVRNDFKQGAEIEMIDWTGSAKIEVGIWEWDEYNDPEDLNLKTTFFMGGTDKPMGTMRSYAGHSIEDFNYYYPSTR